MRESVATENYWRNHWEKVKFDIVPRHHPIRKWIENRIPTTQNASCFEFGCYPGKFLAVFGGKGYTLNGLDSFGETQTILSKWLAEKGYKIGNFHNSDIWEFLDHQQYDVVFSFGFIEHFKEWPKIIRKHANITKQGGLIMIGTPNLNSPLYYSLYKIFEPEVIRNHEFSAMNLKNITQTLAKSGCTIGRADYAGYFYFRFVTKHSKLSKAIAYIINLFRPIFELFPPSVYARYIVVDAIKSC